MPLPRCASSTPVGPKNPRAVASTQAKPTTRLPAIAIQQVIGRRAKAASVSSAQPSLKCFVMKRRVRDRSNG